MTPTEALALKPGDTVTHPGWEGELETVGHVDAAEFPEDPVIFFKAGGFWRSSRLTATNPHARPVTETEKYLLFNIRDVTVGYNDKCILWWRPESKGYTTAVELAGRYTQDEARSICGSDSSKRGVRMVRESVALAASQTHTYCWIDDLLPKDREVNLKRMVEIEPTGGAR